MPHPHQQLAHESAATLVEAPAPDEAEEKLPESSFLYQEAQATICLFLEALWTHSDDKFCPKPPRHFFPTRIVFLSKQFYPSTPVSMDIISLH